ncbi:hypothetical protein PVAND_006465 [Polypedilum vanderplanki]|uniref:Uncharacterized protein n=1 Tax=Polypedilum vanderplanki TaxID=319348 RepID=A0A9J6C4Z3_POLVA|nr:hypothetical protein PVAND_006465 [Polypedilum vanderplanki]
MDTSIKDKEESDDEKTTATTKTIYTTINGPEDEDNYSESEHDESSINFPAISPISNTSSGFISCGSSSSSKPTTPTPSNLNLLNDKNCCDHDDISDNNNNNLSSDNENGELAINKRCENEDNERDNNIKSSSNKFLSSMPSTSKQGVTKFRSKHRNFSFSSESSHNHHHHHHQNKYQQQQQTQPSTVRYRQSKKHISLDDEIVIYESDSSLIESRRRISNQYTMFNRSFQNQGRSSAIAISRHKSEEHYPSTSSSTTATAMTTIQPSNQIVSILKRKDSSGKDSPLVTFSPNVKDVEPTRSMHRQGGILKKRSSLDESRRFRSHSPSSASSESEKGCLIKNNNRRRNSCEEIHQQHHHGILKQKSYESTGGYSSSGTYNSSGVNTPNSSSGVQGILKKPSLTPSDHSDHATKHVSISEAVILAAAELYKDMLIDDSHEPYIKPILKTDNEHHGSHEIKPKPILKKNHSSENEEIRSILKSRKSSRDEPEDVGVNF